MIPLLAMPRLVLGRDLTTQDLQYLCTKQAGQGITGAASRDDRRRSGILAGVAAAAAATGMGCFGLPAITRAAPGGRRILWTSLPGARTVVALFVLASVAGVVGGDDEQDGPWIQLPPTSVDGFRIDATFSRGVEARDPPPLQHHALRTPRGHPSWRAATTANAVRAVQSLVCGAFDLSPLLEDDTVLAPALLRPAPPACGASCLDAFERPAPCAGGTARQGGGRHIPREHDAAGGRRRGRRRPTGVGLAHLAAARPPRAVRGRRRPGARGGGGGRR